MVKDFINKYAKDMIDDLGELVKYNSVLNNDELPFGSENRKVLDTALNLMQAYGLKTKNLDYYCGYGEVGEGEEVIGILAHLDIVPAGDGWNSNPFELVNKDGYLYGRGVSDDKGAVIASLYALRYLIETNYPFKKRVRLITGCNEETGSRCIRHYVEKEGHIDMGFTPDANFPGIYAEKGMLGGEIRGKSNIVEISGGTVSNVVCKEVKCKVAKDSFDFNIFDDYFKEKGIKYDISIDDYINLTIYGKAAHASMPDLGINAINHLFVALYKAGFKDEFVSDFNQLIADTYHGELIGADKLEDEHSNLTMNLGVISKDKDEVVMSLDVRYPVLSNNEIVKEHFEKLKGNSLYLNIRSMVNPLFFDTNSPMIKALMKAYQDATGDKETKMEAIGGGTYAKAINNCIAFGCEFIGEDNHIHDANECLNIANFYKQVELYIEAIKNLNEA